MDVVCQAKSGMGKTAVFVLATLQQLEPVAGQVFNDTHLSSVLHLIPGTTASEHTVASIADVLFLV